MAKKDSGDTGKLSLWVERLTELESGDIQGWMRFLVRQGQLAIFILQQMTADRCMERAAALTYKTVFSLVPLFAVAFSLFKAFNAFEGMEAKVQRAMFDKLLATPLVSEEWEASGAHIVLVRDSTDAGQETFQKAGQYREEGRRGKAIREYLRSVAEGCDPVKAREELSLIRFGDGDVFSRISLDDAVVDLYTQTIELPDLPQQEVLVKQPALTQKLFNIKIVRLKQERSFQEAIRLCRSALEADMEQELVLPHLAMSCHGLAAQFLEGQNWAAALEAYPLAVSYLTDTLVLSTSKRRLSMDRQTLAEAHDDALGEWGVARLNRVREAYAAHTANRLAQTGAANDKVLEDAVAELQKAAQLMADPSEVHTLRADILWDLGKRDEARAAYKQATKSLRIAGARQLTRAAVDYVRDFVSRTSAAGIGVVGVALLVFSSVWLLITIERTLNNIWYVTPRRPMFLRFASFATVLWLGPILLALSIVLEQTFSFYLSKLADQSGAVGGAAGAMGSLGKLVLPLFSVWLALLLMYKFLPHTRVNLGPAALGALVGAVGLQLARKGFALYVKRTVSYSEIYGSLGTVPFFLFWLYILWIIVLFGAEVSFTVQNINHLRIRLRAVAFSRKVVDRFLLLRTAYYVSRDFHLGKGPTRIQDLSRKTELPEEIIGNAADYLIDHGVLAYGGESADTLVPARELDDLPLTELLAICDSQRVATRSRDTDDVSSEEYLASFFESLHQSDVKDLGEMTVRQLVESSLDVDHAAEESVTASNIKKLLNPEKKDGQSSAQEGDTA